MCPLKGKIGTIEIYSWVKKRKHKQKNYMELSKLSKFASCQAEIKKLLER